MNILRKIFFRLTRFLKTDTFYLAKNGSWLLIGQSASVLLALGLTLAFANLLPAEVFGTYRFVISMTGIIGIFSITGLTNAIPQSVARGFSTSLKKGFKLQQKWLWVPLLVSLSLAGYYFWQGNLVLGKSFLIVTALYPLFKSLALFDSYLIGKKKFRQKATYNIISNVLNYGILIGVLFLSDNLFLILAVYLGTLVIPASFFLYKTLKQAEREPDTETDPELFNNAKHLSIMNAFGKAASELDKILIFHFLGPIQLAIYSFALAPIAKMEGFNLVVRDLALPKLANRTIPELQKSLPEKILWSLAVYAPCVALYILAAPKLFAWFLPNYLESVPFTQIAALSLLVSIPLILLNQTLIAHMQQRKLYITKIVSPLMKIALIAVFIPLFGLWGAIIALIGGAFLNLALLSWLFWWQKYPTATYS